MDATKLWNLELLVLDRLQGKLTLLQAQEERAELVSAALNEVVSANPQEFNAAALGIDGELKRAKFIADFLSYDIVNDLLCDSNVEDIIINALKPIYIHHNQKGFVATEKHFKNQKQLDVFIRKLIVFSGRNVGGRKIINLELPNLGGRVNLVMSAFGPQLTITKGKLEPLSIIELINRGSLNYEVAAQLWLYLEGMSIRPANMIIAGGPGTGKTTLLNALFSFIPVSHRMVIIEDTLELNTFLEDSCSRLECDDDLSLADLVKNSLRMRPERIVVGEVRGAEAQDMITAVNVGKYCVGTIHALTSREAILRLQNAPMNIPEILVNLVDVFVVLKRYHVKEEMFRVVDEVSETGGMEQKTILLSQIYKYNYEERQIKSVSTSTIYRDRLAQQAYLTPRDIIDEVHLRALLLKALADRGMTTIKEVTAFCRAYNEKPQEAAAKLGFQRDKFFHPKKK